MKAIRILSVLPVIAFLLALTSCGGKEEVYYPKPRGFYRIELPKQSFRDFDSTYPFSCRIPQYAYIQPIESPESGGIWFNLVFPGFDGMINFSYKPVNGNLYELSEDAREFVNKHITKANNIEERLIHFPNKKVYGISYQIEGANTASPYQFFVTDSTHHYLRGALYFNHVPNNDSIAPLIERIVSDLDTMISSFQWKN